MGLISIYSDPRISKGKVFDEYVILGFTYRMETTTLTKNFAEALRIAQRAMERAMLRIVIHSVEDQSE